MAMGMTTSVSGKGLGSGRSRASLLREAIGNRARLEGRVPLRVADLIQKAQQLPVALLDGVDVAPFEEALPQKPDLPLDAALLVAAVGVAEPQLDAHRARQVEQQRVVT